jgi:uncharacterized integral membrane protein
VPPTRTKPEQSPPLRRPEWPLGSRDTARLAAIGALVLYGLLFVILNIHNVSISFVFFDAHVPVLVALLLAGGIGVGAGWLLSNRRAGRQNRFKP